MGRSPVRHGRDLEFSIGPHPAREGWRVLRVSYARAPEHERRVARALDALVAPLAEVGDAPAATAERARAEAGDGPGR